MGHCDGLRKRQGIKQKKARKRGVFLHSGFINVLISEVTSADLYRNNGKPN